RHRHLLDQDSEQTFVELVGERQLALAPLGVEPMPRDKKQNRLAAADRGAERLLPPFAGSNSTFRIEVEKDVVPAFPLHPVAKRHRLSVLGARVAHEDS